MQFELFRDNVATPEPEDDPKRPLRLSDVQDPIPKDKETQSNDFQKYATYFSSYWLAGRFSESFIKQVEVSPETANALRSSSQEMRNAIRTSMLSPSEHALQELGWKRWVGNSSQLWQVPKGREMLGIVDATSPQIYGKVGLQPQHAPVWRDATGNVFRADPNLHPERYRLERMLTKGELASAQLNGALTTAESHHFRTIDAAQREMQALVDLDKKLSTTGTTRLSLKDLPAERGLCAIHSINNTLHSQHQHALKIARQEVTAGTEAYRQYRGYAVGGLGTLFGTKVINDRLEALFNDAPTSTRTYVIDGLSPLVALSRAHWAGKSVAIVGGHLISRHYDEKDSKKPAPAELENRLKR